MTISVRRGNSHGHAFALRPHSKILLEQSHERLVAVGAKHATESPGGQVRIGDHELGAIVAIELHHDLAQWPAVEFEPPLLPR